MRAVLIDKDPMKIAVAKLHLERLGYLCFVRNEHLSNLTGSSFGPFVFRLRLFDPELCVMKDEEWAEAMQALTLYMKASVTESWVCPKCREAVPASFDFCWSCSSDPNEAEALNFPSEIPNP